MKKLNALEMFEILNYKKIKNQQSKIYSEIIYLKEIESNHFKMIIFNKSKNEETIISLKEYINNIVITPTLVNDEILAIEKQIEELEIYSR